MRIVWASAAFIAGVASALAFGFAPGQDIPNITFALITAAVALSASALILSRRRAAYALLCLIFLIGCWRGGDVTSDTARFAGQADSVDSVQRPTNGYADRPLDRARRLVVERLQESLTETKAGLPIALFTGNRSLLSDQTTNDFRTAGMAHLLAISGLHVSLVGGFAMALFSLFLVGDAPCTCSSRFA